MDKIWCMSGSYYNIPKAIFYLLKGDYNGKENGNYYKVSGLGFRDAQAAKIPVEKIPTEVLCAHAPIYTKCITSM